MDVVPEPADLVAITLVGLLTGVPASEHNRFHLTGMLVELLAGTDRLIVIDEAQGLNRECIEYNWRGRTLTSYPNIVELMGATTTETGLLVRAEWDQGYYPTGTQITDAELAALPLKPDKWHGEWNWRWRLA